MSAARFGLVLALIQETAPITPSDDTERTIRVVIGALLGLAVLLAILTIWYWRRTDPRRTARSAGDRPSSPTDTGRPDPGGPSAPQGGAAPRAAGTPEGGISAEEWLRLTGGGKPPPRSEP